MKKKFILLVALLFILIPIKINAASIKSTSVVGMSSVKKGETITLTYYINFDGIEKNNMDSYGVYAVVFENIYDPAVLELKSLSSDSFESINYTEQGLTFAFSSLKNPIPAKDRCINDVLFCSSYSLKITYEVISDSVTSTSVGMGDVEVALMDMYGEETTEISTSSTATKTIKIKKNEVTTPTNKTENNKTETNKTTPTRSSNKDLKKLEIAGYQIKFDKKVLEYEIAIPDDVNELKIKAEPEHSKATIKITGADDLQKYNNKVFITVMAEDGSSQTYTIRKKEKVEEVKEEVAPIIEEEKTSPKVEFKLTKEHIKIGVIVLLCLIVLLIIRAIIRHFTDRKIDKALDDI